MSHLRFYCIFLAAEVNSLDNVPEGAGKDGLSSGVHTEESNLGELHPAVMASREKSPQDNTPKSMSMQGKTKETMEKGEEENSSRHMDCDRVCMISYCLTMENSHVKGIFFLFIYYFRQPLPLKFFHEIVKVKLLDLYWSSVGVVQYYCCPAN